MSTPTKSKKSSVTPSKPKRIRRIIPNESTWTRWVNKENHDIVVDGVKMTAAIGSGFVWVSSGPISFTNYGAATGQDIRQFSIDPITGGGAGSCAYGRVYPYASTDTMLLAWKWYMANLHIPKGVIAYVTKKDAGNDPQRLKEIHNILKARGFKEVCCNKSIHEGHYPVWLYVSKGDPALRAELDKKKNKKAVKDVDVLGNTTANVLELGNVVDRVAGPAEVGLIPITPAIAA